MKIYSIFKFQATLHTLYTNKSELEEFDFPPFIDIYDEFTGHTFRADSATFGSESIDHGPERPFIRYWDSANSRDIYVYF
jgi:hypothetical protein